MKAATEGTYSVQSIRDKEQKVKYLLGGAIAASIVAVSTSDVFFVTRFYTIISVSPTVMKNYLSRPLSC